MPAPVQIFVICVSKHWVVAVTGPVISGILFAVGAIKPDYKLTWPAYALIAVVGLLYAFYRAWKDEYEKVQNLSNKPVELILPPLLASQLEIKNSEIKTLEQQVRTLENQLAARKIEPMAFATIREWLWSHGKGLEIDIYYLPHASDGEGFASRLKELFEAAEWKVRTLSHISGVDGKGIFICGSKDPQYGQSKGAHIIKAALAEGGYDSTIDDELLGTNILSLVVGRKPDSNT